MEVGLKGGICGERFPGSVRVRRVSTETTGVCPRLPPGKRVGLMGIRNDSVRRRDG